jgi:hypothetical protein
VQPTSETPTADTTAFDTSTGSGSSSTAATETTDAYPDCEGGEWQLFTATASLDLADWPPTSMMAGSRVWDLAAECTVEDTWTTDVQNVSLSCTEPGGAPRLLTLSADFLGHELPLFVGEPVDLRHYASETTDLSRTEWTVLRDSDSALLFGSVTAFGAQADVGFPGDPDAFAPFSFALESGLCMPVETFPCGSNENPCERLAVDASTRGADARIFDGQEETLAASRVPYLVRVEAAVRLTTTNELSVRMIVVRE